MERRSDSRARWDEAERQTKNLRLEAFIHDPASYPLVIDEFEERLWAAAVDIITIMKYGQLVFRFKDGTEG